MLLNKITDVFWSINILFNPSQSILTLFSPLICKTVFFSKTLSKYLSPEDFEWDMLDKRAMFAAVISLK